MPEDTALDCQSAGLLIRLHMSEREADELNSALLRARGSPIAPRLRDVLWLRAALMEQWRRTPVAERRAFARRSDRLLQDCWVGSAGAAQTKAFHPTSCIPWRVMTHGEKETLLLSVKQVASALGISVSGVYRLLDAGELHRLKVGSRTLVERNELERYIAAQRAAGIADRTGENAGASHPAVVLLSGGLDSTTTLAIAKDLGHELFALSFRYGQRHSIELDAAREIAKRVGVEDHVIIDVDLRLFGGSALTAEIDVPKDRSAAEMGDGIPITYVPARNTVFLSFALAWAEVLEADDIFIGVNVLDYSGYPDCRPEYLTAYERMANLATKRAVEGQRLRIHAPLSGLSKAEIVRRGVELGIDHAITRSCYDPSPSGEACGNCDSCQLRLNGFAENGLHDPAPYQVSPAAA